MASPSIAATSTRAMVRAAEDRGFATGDLLREAGLTPMQLEDPDCRIPAPTVLALWEALRERTGDPTLQLVAPLSLPFGAYRVIDYLVAASATVGDGIGRFARFFSLIAPDVTLAVEAAADGHALRLDMADGRPVPPVYVDYVFAALVGRIRMRIRPDLRVRGVELRRAEPPDVRPYRAAFAAPVRFGADADRLRFSAAAWDAPTEGADDALAQLMEDHARILSARVEHPSTGFPAEVERSLAGLLPEGRSAARVARALHMSVRTLQRKLETSGTTFREVSERVAARLAVDYLAKPDVSIAEVAFLLGFGDPSSFNRAFRRWTGVTPGRWRRRRP